MLKTGGIYDLFQEFFGNYVAFSIALSIFLSATAAVSAKNTVYSVLFLVLVFVFLGMGSITIGADFLGISLIIIYVGAIAVLFLFAVMMLDNEEKIASYPGSFTVKFIKTLFAVILSLMPIAYLHYLKNGSWPLNYKIDHKFISSQKFLEFIPKFDNLKRIADYLYVEKLFQTQLVGIILLVGMISAVVIVMHNFFPEKIVYEKGRKEMVPRKIKIDYYPEEVSVKLVDLRNPRRD